MPFAAPGSDRPDVLIDVDWGRRRNLAALAALLALALTLRGWALDQPGQLIFDEQYYALDAYSYLGGTPDLGGPTDPVKIPNEGRWEHPPMAKLLIAAGEGPIGFVPVGWRLPSAVAGTLGVGLVFLLGLALFESSLVATTAGLLVAIDGLHLVQSRVAMLDVFSTTFSCAALLAVLLYRRSGRDRWLLWGGAALGASIASKWSALLLAPLVIGLGVAAHRRREPRPSRARLALALVVLPVAMYVASYAQFWVAHGPAVDDFATLQRRMAARLHDGEDESPAVPEGYRPAPFVSRADAWPLLRPVPYFEGDGRRIVAVGNPGLWWPFLVVGPLLAGWAIVRRHIGGLVVVAGYVLGWAPWLLVGRPTYSYYAVAVVPYMALAVAAAATLGRERRLRASLTATVWAASLAMAAVLLPIWLGTGDTGSLELLPWLWR